MFDDREVQAARAEEFASAQAMVGLAQLGLPPAIRVGPKTVLKPTGRTCGHTHCSCQEDDENDGSVEAYVSFR